MSSDTPNRGFSEDELHALVDGYLSPERAAQIEHALSVDGEAAAQVREWRAQNAAIRAAFADPVGHKDPIVARPRPGLPGWARLAASGLVVAGLFGALGYMIGSAGGGLDTGTGDDGAWLAAAASAMHRTYGREVRHAVEVGVDDYDHLVTWLGNRIERRLTAPVLEDLGFALLGGRLVPVGAYPGAMLMYENVSGERASVIVARNSGARDTAFQYSQSDGVNTLRWIDGSDAYAISGFLERDDLEAISSAVYAHFEGRYHPG